MTQHLTGISLFAGAGGMDIGFRKAGIEALFANEIDADAAASYAANPQYLNGKVLRQGDIAHYLDDLDDLKGTDVVFGGPPCQGFSVAGKMNPDDERSRLIWTFMEAVERVEPSLFVMENVKALGTLSKWAAVRRKLAEKAESLGYGFAMIVLKASDYGVPQARERFIFLGVKGAENQAVERTFLDNIALLRKKPATVREVLSKLPPYGQKGNDIGSVAEIHTAKHPIVRTSPYRGSLLFNGRGRPVDLDSVSKTLPAQMGGNHTPIIDQNLLVDPSAENWVESYHRSLENGSANPAEDRIEVPPHLRRMTVAEAAAIQTFPADFSFTGPYGSQYRQIGNAVPCDFAFVIAQAAKNTLADLKTA